jgi:hypothetical protein
MRALRFPYTSVVCHGQSCLAVPGAHVVKEFGDMLMRKPITTNWKIHNETAINLWRLLKEQDTQEKPDCRKNCFANEWCGC